jgi:hypothetical protein
VNQSEMFYFGPLYESGHYMYRENGQTVYSEDRKDIPWQGWDIDGKLQPGCFVDRGRWDHRGPENEGEALLHHKDGWTALSFWDRTIDTRYGCNSTYIAEGILTFEQMVELAKARFPKRWGMMKFEVRLSQVPRKDAE